jgi:broad specificity phosphatase PhoE
VTETVWVVRHGQRRDTVDESWSVVADRVHDPPLTELGRWAAWRVGRRFASMTRDVDAVYASPFLRAVETAAEITDELGTEFRLEPGLGEHRNPAWFDDDPDVRSPAALAARFDDIVLDHDPLVEPAFPETHATAMDRIGETARRLVAGEAGTVLLVGHGATVGGVVHGLTGDTDDVEAPLCGITTLESVGDRWRLVDTGDVTHLDV